LKSSRRVWILPKYSITIPRCIRHC